MSHSWIPRVTGLTLLAGLALSQASDAATPLISITPVTVTIPSGHRSSLITIRNLNPEPMNIQITPFAWAQDQQAEDRLTPTHDLIVFPLIFTIRPHSERKVRIGTALSAPTERTYRLIVDTLLPSDSQPDAGRSAGFRITTRASIPVFLLPTQPAAPKLAAALTIEAGHLKVQISNTGSLHLPPQHLQITGYADEQTAPILSGTTTGWYLLPNISHTHDIPLPPDKCPSLTVIKMDIRYDTHTTTRRLALPPGACAPS